EWAYVRDRRTGSAGNRQRSRNESAATQASTPAPLTRGGSTSFGLRGGGETEVAELCFCTRRDVAVGEVRDNIAEFARGRVAASESEQRFAFLIVSGRSLAVFLVVLQHCVERRDGVLVVLAAGVDVADIVLRVGSKLGAGEVLQIIGKLL